MPLNLVRGQALIRSAAEKGDAEAQVTLARILQGGEGALAADPAAAERWLAKAAAQGHADAARILKLMRR